MSASVEQPAPHDGPNISAEASDADTAIIDAPMPESSRTRVRVFRDQLQDMADECHAIKMRGRSIPYLFTVGWSALTAAGYAAIGLYVSSNAEPKPSHNIFVMYELGVLLGAVAGLIFLIWGWTNRRSFKTDLDALAKKIERADYTTGDIA